MKIAKLSGKPEIFYSIQGEGLSMGRPSIFIRLSLCNLHCSWCDTDYTWNWKGTPFQHDNENDPGYEKFIKDEQIMEMPSEDILETIHSYGGDRLVVTGGEPLMQQRELATLLQQIKKAGIIQHIEIETNGTLRPTIEIDNYTDQYNVSLKLENSGNKHALRIRPEAVGFFARSAKSNFKFVVANPEDLNEIEILRDDYGIPNDKIILMPLGTSESALNKRESWLAGLCVDRNYRFSDRMHIRLYGNKRGV